MVPCAIAESDEWKFYPAIEGALQQSRVIICERIRTTRRQIKYLFDQEAFDQIAFYEMGKHAQDDYIEEVIRSLKSGLNAAVLSEAGMPCIADPGHKIVSACHRHHLPVHPFAGPSSFMMALMASGLSGQSFQFHGYLSRDGAKRSEEIKKMDRTVRQSGMTQIFMETPYRNQKMLEDILRYAHSDSILCVALDISGAHQRIKSMPIKQWKSEKDYFKEKHPAVFVIGRVEH